MKLEYDVELYKKIANFEVNEVVTVTNSKGRKKIIHITNITKLTWQELQLLVSDGSNNFSKKVLLYEKYKNRNNGSEQDMSKIFKGESLSSTETEEISQYIKIYRENRFKSHTQINNYITENDMWDEFPTIRSLNDHCEYENIPGILQKYFGIVSSILKINGDNGKPLTKATHY